MVSGSVTGVDVCGFESRPDCEEMIIFRHGIRSVKPENLSDGSERRANGEVAKLENNKTHSVFALRGVCCFK
jgi:hypothetical protein